MNAIEQRIDEILSTGGGATEILQLCDELNADEKISLSIQIQNKLKTALATSSLEEAVWDRLLVMISPNELSEDVFNYLIQNGISVLLLCHMQLQDKWLMKLIEFDEAPLYTLAERYYLSDNYSSLDFLQLYNKYLRKRDDLCLHLLDIYRVADKRGLLIYLCSNNGDFEYKERLQWYRAADQVRGLTNSADITSIYKEYQKVGIVLTEIALNFFTSDEVLLELLSVKGITNANRIRESSENTLRLKRMVEQK